MKISRISPIRTTLLMLLLAFGLTSCAQNQQRQPTGNLELTRVAVHLVQTDKPYKFRNEKNQEQQVSTAYMVFFDVKNLPQAYATNINFYIGSYKVPEYGGTPTGIYFRIYDTALVSRLNNQPVFFKIGTLQQKPFNKTFVMPDRRSLKVENEQQLLKRGQ